MYTVCAENDCANGQVDWVTVTAITGTENYTLRASPDNPNNAAIVGTNNLWLKTHLADYADVAAVYQAFSVTVVDETCNCENLAWTLPSMAT